MIWTTASPLLPAIHAGMKALTGDILGPTSTITRIREASTSTRQWIQVAQADHMTAEVAPHPQSVDLTRSTEHMTFRHLLQLLPTPARLGSWTWLRVLLIVVLSDARVLFHSSKSQDPVPKTTIEVMRMMSMTLGDSTMTVSLLEALVSGQLRQTTFKTTTTATGIQETTKEGKAQLGEITPGGG